MPGIAGIIGRGSATEQQRRVNIMLASMRHEPFYECGTCSAPDMHVYAGWVAHPRSYAATHSGSKLDSGVGLVFAGECYGDAPRADHVREAYSRHGEAFPGELNGLFCGLLIDSGRKRAVLFNDRYGVERLYYHQQGETLYFASEAKALLVVLPELRAFDDVAVAEFVSFGCTLDWKSLYRGVRCLDGATTWLFDCCRSARKSTYFDRRTWEEAPSSSVETFEAEFVDTFYSKVLPRYVGSGDEVAVSLTGGLDTRMIMAGMSGLARRPVCYTFGGLNGETADARTAATVADACGLDHRLLRIGPDFLTNFGAHVDRTAYVTDGCFGATGAHEMYLNARARRVAPVRLTGNFGSEILRGVTTLKPIPVDPQLLASDFQALTEATVRAALTPEDDPVGFAAFKEIPWRLFGTLAAAKSQVIFRTPYLDNDIVALAFRAPTRLRQGPGLALAVVGDRSRVLSKIPTDRGVFKDGNRIRYLLGRLLAEATFKLDYYFTEAMPATLSRLDSIARPLSGLGILGRHKFLPYRRWFRSELAAYVTEVLTDVRTFHLPYWNRRTLASLAADHISGRRNRVREIDAVLTLEAVNRLIVNNSLGRLAA